MVSWRDGDLLVTIVGVGALRQLALITIGILNQSPCGVGGLQQIAGTVMLITDTDTRWIAYLGQLACLTPVQRQRLAKAVLNARRSASFVDHLKLVPVPGFAAQQSPLLIEKVFMPAT